MERGKKRVKIYIYTYKRRNMKKKKMYKAWKRGEREVENSVAFHTVCERNGVQKPKLQDVQLEARLDERRDCQRRQQKALPTTLTPSIFSSWISSNSSKRLTAPLPFSSSLFFSILSTIAEEDFTRKSSAWYTNDTII